MTQAILASLSFAVLLATIAFIRERRFRLALQRVLVRLLKHWRKDEQNRDPGSSHYDDGDRLPE